MPEWLGGLIGLAVGGVILWFGISALEGRRLRKEAEYRRKARAAGHRAVEEFWKWHGARDLALRKRIKQIHQQETPDA
ncbi:hypothetical protein LCGC14_1051460 [marine sediment metagenome]|uniref:Uncharacterized protein n=1 Tax=marine sediment metagenome TaxID=412755 RepID=A0A0F9NAJ6_9ZZZZ